MPSSPEFVSYVKMEKYHLIGASETWLENTVPDNYIAIPNSAIYRKDRVTRGGGLYWYVNQAVDAQVRVLNIGSVDDLLEQLWIGVKINKCKYAFGLPTTRCPNRSGKT
ncbi:hypothetical protein HHI36_003777 [Cryptolaemus montrouzieri]|uniref:Uncharacterized protein n=1 Tax=Cryptolaemus montrouzieri TaxID=559131 RepID=A0ABD2NPG4_9CUCU